MEEAPKYPKLSEFSPFSIKKIVRNTPRKTFVIFFFVFTTKIPLMINKEKNTLLSVIRK